MARINSHRFTDPEVRPAILTAIVLLAQAVIAKNVLEVDLDFFTQFAPLYVFIAYQVSQLRTRTAELAFSAAIVLVAIATLTLYAAT